MELKELYQEIILDHAKNLAIKANVKIIIMMQKLIMLCVVRKVHIYLKLKKDKNIKGLSFEGEGCAISLASASILTDIIKGKNFFYKKITNDF